MGLLGSGSKAKAPQLVPTRPKSIALTVPLGSLGEEVIVRVCERLSSVRSIIERTSEEPSEVTKLKLTLSVVAL